MKTATLALIMKGDQVLLGYKKKGEIGSNTLNGPGGKQDEGESLLECVVRETHEEIGIHLEAEKLNKVAIITFYNANVPDFEVHVFRTEHFNGTPQETADMIPAWYSVHSLPFEKMLESDREWFKKAVTGEKFCAHVYYRERAKDFDKIEFLPFT